MSKVTSITDAELVYFAKPDDVTRLDYDSRYYAVKDLVRALDLQALGAIVGSKDKIEDDMAAGETGWKAQCMCRWVQFVVDHMRSDPNRHNELGKGACILIAVEKDGTVRIVTWSVSKSDCNAIKPLVDRLFEQVTAVPFRTVFGWGNGGVPMPLTDAELATLKPGGLEYALGYVNPRPFVNIVRGEPWRPAEGGA